MSSARDRVMREAAEEFDREEAARTAAAHSAKLNRVAAAGFPTLAGLNKQPRAAAPRISGGPSRADRAAKSTSNKPGAPLAADVRRAGMGKVDRPGNPSRFAHFAGMSTVAPIADEPMVTDITPTDAAAFVLASAAKARGQKPTALAKPRPPIAADMSTPEGVADFVAASVAKARGQKK
ncbi:MAG: hypothetical protein ACRYG8_31520 [Janthinobacterium lividum]